ncbi:hypothetical protein JUJ52_08720 [Virgibacillus sp. AGTR]|uniref:BC1872 family protein n=1 Tax=Virgibacillus sp. AGTR TaxID=2812055 RepID=UPI001963F26D|nr:hypothetical protein [Virgibacillus sp. AGTR]MCC2250048.1 hypothetical protein [Virgibacillus sp. AGTR]QRZ17501.1 hypothetical protein JUJ52_17285 [Virgibacillus sp. AGTR]
MDNRKIDQLVAEKVMGFEVRNGQRAEDGKRFGIPSYSQKIEDAWQVVEKLDRKYEFELTRFEDEDKWYCDLTNWNDDLRSIRSVEKTAPLAICKAALKTVGVEV